MRSDQYIDSESQEFTCTRTVFISRDALYAIRARLTVLKSFTLRYPFLPILTPTFLLPVFAVLFSVSCSPLPLQTFRPSPMAETMQPAEVTPSKKVRSHWLEHGSSLLPL